MSTLVLFKEEFDILTISQLINRIKEFNPSAHESQIQSWDTLIKDLKNSPYYCKLPDKLIISFEYNLPTEGMAIDLLLTGINNENKKTAYIIEAKQWNDSLIEKSIFTFGRFDGMELHPQIQVSKHKLSFSDYLNIGKHYVAKPFVFVRNCSATGIENLISKNPKSQSKSVPVFNRIDKILEQVVNEDLIGNNEMKDELLHAEYMPSKEILTAMKSIITKEEPFILTKEQSEAVKKIKQSILDGKKIIRIKGAAGTGKTAILLNLYVALLDNIDKSEVRPIFISGAQNTKLYRSLYPDIEQSFSYSYSLYKMVPKTRGFKRIILMDEAQHNEAGIISEMVSRNAILIICYDENQVINATNSAISELIELESREDFISIELKERIRFNGSQKADNNIKACLDGKINFENDNLFDFKYFTNFNEFQNQIFSTIRKYPNSTIAVAGLISNDSEKYTINENPCSKFFTKWGHTNDGYYDECNWLPYINSKNYLANNNGNIWVGTWWMPGLDVDYIAVIVGGDAIMTKEGLVAIPENAKHFRMMVSIAIKLGLKEPIIVSKLVKGQKQIMYGKSVQNIIPYINNPENHDFKEKFMSEFSKLLKNNYYITMSRGRKGCFIYFTQNVYNE